MRPHDRQRRADVLRLCRTLSERYGRAQACYYSAQGDGSTWLVTEHGTVVRRYPATGEGDDERLTLGTPLPQERTAWRGHLGYPAGWDPATADDDRAEEWQDIAFDLAPEIAAAHGISPLGLSHTTHVQGTGLLAPTPYATDHEVPPQGW